LYLSRSDQLIEELKAADTVVIGAPMYNYSISSQLKAWIDQIVRRGKTVSYGPEGPHGLLQGKKVVVVTSRGGSPKAAFDFQEPYLRAILGLIGLADVTFIHAEKQMSRDADTVLADVTAQISRIAREQAQAECRRSPEHKVL
jgi:FMN-dependent NADH-azoreductase